MRAPSALTGKRATVFKYKHSTIYVLAHMAVEVRGSLPHGRNVCK